jgi:electron-transferring-flavoprotein dehydrogenase
MPKLTAPGVLICGDAGGMVNVPELKGIHYAMHAGILAAERIVEALKGDSTDLRSYDYAVRESLIGRDLHRTRNMRQPFGRGFFIGGAVANAMIATGGRLPGGHWKTHPDAEMEVFDGGHSAVYPKPDGRYTFDKLSSAVHQRQLDPRRRARPHSHPAPCPAPARGAVAVDVPGRRVRGPRGRSR